MKIHSKLARSICKYRHLNKSGTPKTLTILDSKFLYRYVNDKSTHLMISIQTNRSGCARIIKNDQGFSNRSRHIARTLNGWDVRFLTGEEIVV